MRLLRTVAPVTCAAALVVLCVPHLATRTIRAASHRIIDPICQIRLDPHDKFTRVGAPVMPRNRFGLTSASANLSIITVNYTGFSPQAQAAFQAAVDIWQTLVQSSVPIVVDATFRDFGDPGLLGQAGSGIARDFSNGRPGFWYAFPLANSLAGFDLASSFNPPADTHIFAEFNSTADWYYGTDGQTPSLEIDFESVVLHELGHGLGFFGSGDVPPNSNIGTIGFDGFPTIYDTSVVDSGNVSVLNYPNNSTQLFSLFTSNALFWNGAQAVAANGGARSRVYAPSSGFERGSSYSHLDDATYPAGNINSLMTHAIGFAESIHTPGPIALGMFRDMGWTTAVGAGGCIYTLSPSAVTIPHGGGVGSVMLTTQAGCTWTAASNDTAIATITGGASGTGSDAISYNVTANASPSFRSTTLTIGGQTFTINQNGTGPAVAIDSTALIFGATSNGVALVNKTTAQTVRLTQSGTGTATWTASSNRPWLTVAPGSSSGPGTLTIGVAFAPGLVSTQVGTITIAFTGAGNAATLTINVRLNVTNVGRQPFGSFDTPLNGTTGITGSVAVTGWALDDVEVSAVRIFRDPVAGEGGSIVFIGNAVFVDGARTDIVSIFPLHPRNTRAGWGYLLLSNFLPNQGNGTFRLHAFADDVDGHTVLLGSKTITCANATSIAPFGAIDTPAQGQTVSGTINNFGWALIRSATGARADVPGGATVTVVIDGAAFGTPAGWTSRSDITALFPTGFSTPSSAVAFLPIDTTTLTNGIHTIAWGVTATNGQGAGIGSRYFTVSNSSMVLDPSSSHATTAVEITTPKMLEMPRAAAMRMGPAATLADEISSASVDMTPLRGRRGFELDARLKTYKVSGGLTTIQSEELDRIELHLGAGRDYAGYLRTTGGVAPLPIGSHLEPSTGVFTWQPGVGFVGVYDFAFVRWRNGRAVARHDVRILLNPKGSGRVGPQVVIDTPSPTQGRRDFSRGNRILVAGWAADLDSEIDSGVDTVHVWAYPVLANGTRRGEPLFIGAAAYGGSRPDVAAVYGDRFKKSGYGIEVDGLSPGTYDVAVFAYSTVSGGFVPAKTVRITIR